MVESAYATHDSVTPRNGSPGDCRYPRTARRHGVRRELRRSHAKGQGPCPPRDSRRNRARRNAARIRHAALFHSRMSVWPAPKARRPLAALQRTCGRFATQSGSHRTMRREGWPQYRFAYHDKEELGPVALAEMAKHTGLRPEDL